MRCNEYVFDVLGFGRGKLYVIGHWFSFMDIMDMEVLTLILVPPFTDFSKELDMTCYEL